MKVAFLQLDCKEGAVAPIAGGPVLCSGGIADLLNWAPGEGNVPLGGVRAYWSLCIGDFIDHMELI
jgi:hypothetical protein